MNDKTTKVIKAIAMLIEVALVIRSKRRKKKEQDKQQP